MATTVRSQKYPSSLLILCWPAALIYSIHSKTQTYAAIEMFTGFVLDAQIIQDKKCPQSPERCSRFDG
ncbi:hypothetical protein AX14_013825 [Amanita brunnescens Koide BX004]|nr:hypothetical protein AX14_013825 [Amanita brunnescens Koide BX004]